MTDRFDTFGPPQAEAAWEATPVDDGGELSPREAALLLDRTTQRARRAFEGRALLLFLVGATTVLVAYGAVWLSVRHQHPYRGPHGVGLGVMYGVLAVWIVIAASVRGRQVSGVGGRAARRRRIFGTTFAVVWICVYVLQGALAHAGATHAIAYGIWPAVGPLALVGAAAAAYSAARESWSETCAALAAVVLGAGAAFAGPRSVWLVTGIGLAAIVAALGAVREYRLRT